MSRRRRGGGRWRDDEGSLALASLLAIVGAGLSLALLTGTLQLVDATRVERSRVVALQAARTGLASALANLRAAKDADGNGVVSMLPCDITGAVPQVTGSVGESSATFRASVTYLSQDPAGRSAAWVAANGVTCTNVVPRFAYVVSVGTAAVSGYRRTLFGTYAFKSLRKGNMPGGQMHVWKEGGAVHDLCMDAGLTPVPGTDVLMQPCAVSADGTPVPQQKWGYQPNLTITLTTADPVLYPNGLCLDAGPSQSAKKPVKLQQCGATTLMRQQWSFNYASGFFGTSDGKKLNTYCFNVEKPDTPGTRVVLNDTSGGLGNGNSACNTNFPNGYQTWVPDPAVGAGAAGLPVTKQLANFEQFGRCFDVTNMDVTIPHEVVFPCKQTPDPADRDWNQQWDLPASVGTISTQAPQGRYCVTAPVSPAAAPPLLVSVQPCGTGSSERTTWHVRGSDAPSYTEAYRIEGTGAYAGLCLQPLPEAPAWQQADKAGLKPCNGDRIQKWNATPDSTGSAFTDIGER